MLKTVVKRLIDELNFDPTPENLAELPPLATVTPVPKWAKEEATKLGLIEKWT
ncbi:MAG: hypothetical protein WA996_04355 [Candidatus Promineifilaceae bacterium]